MASTVWVGVRAFLAKGELEAAVPVAELAQRAILVGDLSGARAAADELAVHTSAAAALTGDPVWAAYESLPILGPNLVVLHSLAASVDQVSSGAIRPLAEASSGVDLGAFAPANGRIDLQPLIDLREPIQRAAAAFAIARAVVLRPEVSNAAVIGPLANARDEYLAAIAPAADALDALDRTMTLLPAMLGSGGPRETLVLFQNNAELRSLGGTSGSLALVRTEQGAISLEQQASSGDFPQYDPPVVDLPLETRALWGDNTARFIQDVNFTPQFPLTSTIAREMWKREFGTEVQAVVAVDPVAMSYVLRATGPISLANGDQLTADNAVSYLLVDVYAGNEAGAADAVFQDVTSRVFDALMSGSADPAKLVEALARAGAERRILVWNVDASEQAILDGTTLAGALPQGDADHQAFGVYLNDMTGSKMDTYLGVEISTGVTTCRNDGLPLYEVHVKLTNNAPADAATSLPAYVTGAGEHGTPPGQIATTIHVYGERGSYNLGVLLDDQPVGYHPTSDSGYTLSKVVSRLAPGQTATYRFGFLGGTAGEKTPVVSATPLIATNVVEGVALSCESAVW
ncbi:DUF4012 domain-containing protein [Agromyces sp. MMS24-K17]|uniref:DUF4012 domain-containing protein n=1 Tax=Agromyces sp. MMS24-K17 TaxID=3372850 RepID=UPI00375405BD